MVLRRHVFRGWPPSKFRGYTLLQKGLFFRWHSVDWIIFAKRQIRLRWCCSLITTLMNVAGEQTDNDVTLLHRSQFVGSELRRAWRGLCTVVFIKRSIFKDEFLRSSRVNIMTNTYSAWFEGAVHVQNDGKKRKYWPNDGNLHYLSSNRIVYRPINRNTHIENSSGTATYFAC